MRVAICAAKALTRNTYRNSKAEEGKLLARKKKHRQPFIADKEIQKIIDEHSQDSCKWSLKHGRPKKVLKSTLIDIYKTEKPAFSYRLFARRAAHGRLGFTRPHNKISMRVLPPV